MKPTVESPYQTKPKATRAGRGVDDAAPFIKVEYSKGEQICYSTWKPETWKERLRLLFGGYIVVGQVSRRPIPMFLRIATLDSLTGKVAVQVPPNSAKSRKKKRPRRRSRAKAKVE